MTVTNDVCIGAYKGFSILINNCYTACRTDSGSAGSSKHADNFIYFSHIISRDSDTTGCMNMTGTCRVKNIGGVITNEGSCRDI